MFFWSGLSLLFFWILKAQKMGCRWQSSQCYCHSGVESVTATVHKADRGVIVQDQIDETPLCVCVYSTKPSWTLLFQVNPGFKDRTDSISNKNEVSQTSHGCQPIWFITRLAEFHRNICRVPQKIISLFFRFYQSPHQSLHSVTEVCRLSLKY